MQVIRSFSVFAVLASVVLARPHAASHGLVKRHHEHGTLLKRATGEATYYTPASTWTNPSKCNTVNTEQELVAAIANGGSHCGQTVHVEGPLGSVDVTVVELCPSCAEGSIDLSPAAFDKVADHAAGRVPITISMNGETVGNGDYSSGSTTTSAAAAATSTTAVTANSGGACVEGAIVCNADGTFSQCGSGMLQVIGAVPGGSCCTNGAIVPGC